MSLVGDRAGGFGGGGGHNRPRRPNPETLSYLKSLPLLDWQAAGQEIASFLLQNEQQDFPQHLAAALSATDDIRMEVASIAGDEAGAEILEALIRLTAPYSELASRIWLQSVVGYCLHLATHRYGSHVLQTILQQAVCSTSSSADLKDDASDLALHPDAPPLSALEETSSLPSLLDVVLAIQQELTPYVSDLAVHVCGSHVLRTLVCVLGGVKLIVKQPDNNHQFRRGKNKKKRKSSESDKESAAAACLDITFEQKSRLYCPAMNRAARTTATEHLDAALLDVVREISGDSVKPPGKLQQLACHPSAGPLLIVLLRTLTLRDAADSEDLKLLDKWDELHAQRGQDYHLGRLRPEPTFSIGSQADKLFQRLICWDGEDEKGQKKAGDVLYGLAGEARGSHLLQVMLQVASDDRYASIVAAADFLNTASMLEYIQHDVSNYVVQTLLATTRSVKQTSDVLEAVLPSISSGLVVDATKKRRGILWRAVEAAAKYNVKQEAVVAAIVQGFGVGSSVSGIGECVPRLLNVTQPEREGDRVGLDAPGARCVYHLLQFQSCCLKVYRGVADLPPDDLELLAKDGLGSRCIWEALLQQVNEMSAKEEKKLLSLSANLVSHMQGRWVKLACDRIGQHVVTKVVFAPKLVISMPSRQQIVEELVQSRSRLKGSAMGRQVLTSCLVEEFHNQGQEEWMRLVNKKVQKAEWLDEILAGDDDDFMIGKRKKRRKKKGEASGGCDDKANKAESSGSIDAILGI